jgi:hypothetical protein
MLLGGVLDVSEATEKYFDESSYPVMVKILIGSYRIIKASLFYFV